MKEELFWFPLPRFMHVRWVNEQRATDRCLVKKSYFKSKEKFPFPRNSPAGGWKDIRRTISSVCTYKPTSFNPYFKHSLHNNTVFIT